MKRSDACSPRSAADKDSTEALSREESMNQQEETEPAPVKLASTWVKVPPVELDCSRWNMNSTASPRGGVEC